MILEDPQGCRVPIPGKDTIRIYDVDAAFGNNLQLLCDSGRVMFNDQTVSNDLITGYEWNFGDGNNSTGVKNPVHFYKQTGLHPVSLKVTTRMGCTDIAQLPLPLKIVASPVAEIAGSAGACIPAVLTFEGKLLKPDTSSLRWKWDFRNGNSSTDQAPSSVTFTNAGQYAVQLIVTNSSGCADTVIKSVQAYPLPALDAGLDQVICRGTTASLSASGANTYQWQTDNTLTCLQCPTPLASPLVNTTYQVRGINGFGCEATDTVRITVKQPFTVQAHLGDTLCKGESLELFANGAELYEWYPAAGLDKADASRPKARPDASVTYRVVGKDDRNCFTDTAYVPMVVYPWPVVSAGEDQKVGTGSSVTLKATISPDATSFRWMPATGLSCIDCLTPVAAPRQSIMYTLEARNEGGCLSRDMVSLHVFCDNSNLFIPNTFSPNSDGHNDVFYPRGKGVFSIRAFRVFNRWGDLVFERTNFQPNDITAGWNGMHKGRMASPDVYIYTLEVVCTNNTIFNEKGNVTLMR
jgi:gliding motility-associated-like protein